MEYNPMVFFLEEKDSGGIPDPLSVMMQFCKKES